MKLHFLTNLSLMKQIAQLRSIAIAEIEDTKLIADAEKNKEKLKTQWDKHAGKIEASMREIVRNEWKDLEVQVFVFPNYIQIGACNCEEFKILFGYQEEYPGFGLITICHEIIHMLIYKYRKNHDISRLTDEIFVFLTAECELRKRLFNKEYFSSFFSGPLSSFHEEALKKSRELQKSWLSYLSEKNVSCKSFLDFIEKNISMQERKEYNNIKLTDFIGDNK